MSVVWLTSFCHNDPILPVLVIIFTEPSVWCHLIWHTTLLIRLKIKINYYMWNWRCGIHFRYDTYTYIYWTRSFLIKNLKKGNSNVTCASDLLAMWVHDDVIKRKYFPRYWPFGGGGGGGGGGDLPVTSQFPTQRPVMWSFDVFFNLRLNKPLSKQSRGSWYKTQSRSLLRHCNFMIVSRTRICNSHAILCCNKLCL